ncbi:type II inositol 3,4-bisphosphate 4-phosphatase-like [Hypomesus transpacificus]|uniref:type II inositol 3,4-bisphosphate 4-phosphatase-like n=1 Tax=Hypomesus transpacificus TaxID=137520 RepID=UPI001F080555|nr:type II inositol 3,4-bisphosphate 4-phosphatase-like [Hypomesus transpacificus]
MFPGADPDTLGAADRRKRQALGAVPGYDREGAYLLYGRRSCLAMAPSFDISPAPVECFDQLRASRADSCEMLMHLFVTAIAFKEPFQRNVFSGTLRGRERRLDEFPDNIKSKAVHPVFFNIGINQQQSLAERFGDSSVQDRINQRSFELLKVYYNTLKKTLPSVCGVEVEEVLVSLQVSLQSRRRKNTDVLWLAAQVCRALRGVRLTSCKSAKDRTSMSVTLEQVRVLSQQHNLSPQHFPRALDCMRSARQGWGQMAPGGCGGCVQGQAPPPSLAVLLVSAHLLVVWLLLLSLVLLARPL